MWNQKGFAIRLRYAIRIRKTTQKILARKLEVAESTFSQWLTGLTHAPNLHTLDALSKILKVHPCWLTYGSTFHEPPEWKTFLEEMEIAARDERRRKGEIDED
jgi:transcriptional regulator with XRE-family HTH domain